MSKSFHFLGVGGIGMSALAHILVEKGVEVTGSDLNPPSHLKVPLLSTLPKEGTVVYSSAIPDSHPDFVQAKQENRLLHRSELLRDLLTKKKGLLVAGTHGKTSTSALLAWTLISAKIKPSYAIGGILQNLQKNGGYGTGEYFVVEADESDGSFLNYSGEGAIITNIEKEHLEHWKTEDKLIAGFQTFISKIKHPNLLFWCHEDPLLNRLQPPGISYGKGGALKLLSCEQRGKLLAFTAQFEGKVYSDIEIPLMGEKLALNALAVFGMALKLGLSEKGIRQAFKTFKGVKRRQEVIGEAQRVMIYDDYAHHPTEIQVLLESFKKAIGAKRLIALFQPHRYTRTRALFSEFTKVFGEADLTIITEIYPAGEAPIPGITSQKLAQAVEHAVFIEKEKIVSFVPKLLMPGDVLVTIGAGDITALGPKILKALK